jgi:hypothetical protein
MRYGYPKGSGKRILIENIIRRVRSSFVPYNLFFLKALSCILAAIVGWKKSHDVKHNTDKHLSETSPTHCPCTRRSAGLLTPRPPRFSTWV